eukprot:2802896-Amphidinium_carterae.1
MRYGRSVLNESTYWQKSIWEVSRQELGRLGGFCWNLGCEHVYIVGHGSHEVFVGGIQHAEIVGILAASANFETTPQVVEPSLLS